MKKIILLITVAIFSTTLCMAQQKPMRKQMTPEQMTEKMVNDLQLNSKQEKKLKKLNEKYAEVLQKPDRMFQRGYFRGPNKQRPPHMQKESDENVQETPNMGKRPDSEGKRPEMSDEQREKMKEKMAEFKKQQEEYQKELKDILTEAQYKKYLEMKNHRGGKGMHHPKKARTQTIKE